MKVQLSNITAQIGEYGAISNIIKRWEGSMKFYIADTHFGHESVINMCKRPFSSIEEMDETLIVNWNSVVSPDDEIYILGDFIFKSKLTPLYYLDQLKGKKHLILGNHEKWRKQVKLSDYFETINQYDEIVDEGQRIILFHYPLAEWAAYYRDSLHIFGHIHNNRTGAAFEFYRNQPRMLNAGVDINHFFPVTLTQLIANNDTFRK